MNRSQNYFVRLSKVLAAALRVMIDDKMYKWSSMGGLVFLLLHAC